MELFIIFSFLGLSARYFVIKTGDEVLLYVLFGKQYQKAVEVEQLCSWLINTSSWYHDDMIIIFCWVAFF